MCTGHTGTIRVCSARERRPWARSIVAIKVERTQNFVHLQAYFMKFHAHSATGKFHSEFHEIHVNPKSRRLASYLTSSAAAHSHIGVRLVNVEHVTVVRCVTVVIRITESLFTESLRAAGGPQATLPFSFTHVRTAQTRSCGTFDNCISSRSCASQTSDLKSQVRAVRSINEIVILALCSH